MDLMGGLTRLKRVPGSMRMEIYVDEEDRLIFASPMYRHWMAYTGECDRVASVNLTILRKFAKDMPKGDPLVFEVRDEYLHIGTLGLTCKMMS